ncbi:MAG: flippase-like domain-containing protein, partial [Candidatus Omnitrophica bacterium]|nr:flippase-like domain-containing protein [Candidatus Omnitrophota bacterium]
MKIPFKNSTRLIVTYLITIAIFLVLFKHIPISNVISGLKNTNPILISFALVISFLSNIIITSLRYKLIIKHLGKNLSLFESMQIKGGCSVFKTLLPARAGEFISMEYLKRNGDFAYSDSFFAIVAEYILNVLALIIFILLGIVLFCLGLNCQLAQNFSRRATFFVLSLNHPIHENKDNLINKLSQNFKKYYIKFKELCGYRSIIICTILCMGAEVINFYLLSRALNVPIPLNTV